MVTPVAYGISQARGQIRAAPAAYATATATPDPRCICDLHHSSQPRWILNPLSKARAWTCNLMVPSWIRFWCTTMGTSSQSHICSPVYEFLLSHLWDYWWKGYPRLFVSISLISLSLAVSCSISVALKGFVLISYYGWTVFRCVFVQYLPKPFICWWILCLIPCLGLCE